MFNIFSPSPILRTIIYPSFLSGGKLRDCGVNLAEVNGAKTVKLAVHGEMFYGWEGVSYPQSMSKKYFLVKVLW